MYRLIFSCYFAFFLLIIATAMPDSLQQKLLTLPERNHDEVYIHATKLYLDRNDPSSIDCANKGLAFAIKYKKSENQALIHSLLSIAYLRQNRFSESLSAIDEAIQSYTDLNIDTAIAKSYLQQGQVFKEQAFFEEAKESYSKAFEIYKNIEHADGICEYYNLMGGLSMREGQMTQAGNYYHKAIRLAYQMNKNIVPKYNYSLALFYRDTQKNDSAIMILNQNLQLLDSAKNKRDYANNLNLIASVYFKLKDYKKAEAHYKNALFLRKSTGISADVAASYTNLAIFYRDINKLNEAESFLNQALQVRDSLGDKKSIALNYNLLGGLKWKQRVYDKALFYYLKSQKLAVEADDELELANALVNIGSILYELKNVKCVDYLAEALTIYTKIKDLKKIANTRLLLGNAYFNLNKFDEAIDQYAQIFENNELDVLHPQYFSVKINMANAYMNKALYGNTYEILSDVLKLARDQHNNLALGNAYNMFGNLHFEMKKMDQALEYFLKAADHAKKSNSVELLSLCLRKAGEIYIEQGNLQSAFSNLKEALALSEKTNNIELKKYSFYAINQYYSLAGDYKNAYYALGKYVTLSDSVTRSLNNEKLLQLQISTELSRQDSQIATIENEITVMKQQRELDELKLSKQQNLLWFFLLFLLFSFITLLLLFNRFQLKKRANLLLQEKFNYIQEMNAALKKSQSELQLMNNTKDKFFSIIAHDLKNPLSGLMGFTELLIRDNQISDSERMKMLSMLYDSSKQLYSLLENLLHWARSQTGRIDYTPVDFHIYELVEGNFSLMKTIAANKCINLVNAVEPAIKVLADRSMIQLVLRNLISNAIKFTPNGGTITVLAEVINHKVKITVSDTGVGMTQDDIQKLFRMDVKFTNEGTNNESGTGLGLILCKEFILRNDGSIHVESELNKGSNFIFTLSNF